MFGAILGAVAGAATSGLFSKREADKQQDFQQAMSDTAHQREVADLRAAGLNPILSAGGSGASTPTGSMGSIPDLSQGVTGGINSAVSLKRAKADVQNVEAMAEGNRVNAEIKKDMWKFYKQNPTIQNAVKGAALANEVGLPPTVGMTFGGAKDVLEQVSDPPNSAIKKRVQSTKFGSWLRKMFPAGVTNISNVYRPTKKKSRSWTPKQNPYKWNPRSRYKARKLGSRPIPNFQGTKFKGW